MEIKEAKNVVVSETLRSFSFKPDTMCKTPEEFTLELCKYAQQNHLDLVITKERYERIRRICRVCNLCLLPIIIVCMILAWQGIGLSLVLCLLVAAVNIGVQIWWIQKKA